VLVETLASEFDLVEVAMAAIRLAHEATAEGTEMQEIPEARGRDGADRGAPRGREEARRSRGGARGDTARLFVGAGRSAGVTTRDLLDLLSSAARLERRHIGSIEIGDRSSSIEIPAERAKDVAHSLRAINLNGKKVTVRIDEER
jgi:ATP-dependent RNA helicase DeaD